MVYRFRDALAITAGKDETWGFFSVKRLLPVSILIDRTTNAQI